MVHEPREASWSAPALWRFGRERNDSEARRAGIFVESQPEKSKAPSGATSAATRTDDAAPPGLMSLAHRMGEGGRRPGEGFSLVCDSTNMPRLTALGKWFDNSPAFQGWVSRQSNTKVPPRDGRAVLSSRTGLGKNCGQQIPAMNGWAIFNGGTVGRSVL
jgi:hypothetical protein